jgi:hypothetical protein
MTTAAWALCIGLAVALAVMTAVVALINRAPDDNGDCW